MDPELISVLFWWTMIGGGVGLAIGHAKGRDATGFWLGLLLCWIGWLIVGFMSRTPEVEARQRIAVADAERRLRPAVTPGADGRPGSSPNTAVPAARPCPWCAELIKPAAIVCRFCGRDVERIPEVEAPATEHRSYAASDEAFRFFARELDNVASREMSGRNRKRDVEALLAPIGHDDLLRSDRSLRRCCDEVAAAMETAGNATGWTAVDGVRMPQSWVEHYQVLADSGDHRCPAVIAFIEQAQGLRTSHTA